MTDNDSAAAHIDVAIIGAGFGGLGAGIRLEQEGRGDFLIFERDSAVGGTWHVNTYPGAQCDIPSALYSFSFAPNPDWTRLYPLQPEIEQYLNDCTDRFGIRDRIRFGHEVLDATWDDDRARWIVRTSGGTWTSRILIGALGPFSEPATPSIDGLDSFSGSVFHSARWNHEHSAEGKRLAVYNHPAVLKVCGIEVHDCSPLRPADERTRQSDMTPAELSALPLFREPPGRRTWVAATAAAEAAVGAMQTPSGGWKDTWRMWDLVTVQQLIESLPTGVEVADPAHSGPTPYWVHTGFAPHHRA